jgi:hypothetical protein
MEDGKKGSKINFTMFVKGAFWRKIFLGHPHRISISASFHKRTTFSMNLFFFASSFLLHPFFIFSIGIVALTFCFLYNDLK